MSGEGSTIPTLDDRGDGGFDDGFDDDVQKPNIAFTLVARNDRTKKMWKDPKNKDRYMSGPRAHGPSKVAGEYVEEGASVQAINFDEPSLRFRFNQKPKDYAKGFLLGSNDESCDAVLGELPTFDPEMVAFTFNNEYELIMNVLSNKHTTVTFNDQRSARRQKFSWILPRGQCMIRVSLLEDVAHQLVFDVIFPRYDPDSMNDYHENCKQFINPGFEVLFEQVDPFFLSQEPLGHGSFGVVRKVRRMPDGTIFAAKALKVLDSTNKDNAAVQLDPDEGSKEVAEEAEKAFKREVEKAQKAFKKEVEMLKLVSKPPHDNIVQFVDEWYGNHTPTIIFEYMPGGTLQAQLMQMQNAKVQMDPREIVSISHQLMNAVEFIHDKGIVHQDIKPGNILRNARNQCVLADFGCAGLGDQVRGGRGTRKYMAPESDKEKPYGFAADVWSLGVVILHCLDGLPNEDGKPRPEWCEHLRQKVMDYHLLVEKYSDRTLEIQTTAIQLILLVQRYMLQLDPANRLSAKKLLKNYPLLWNQGIPEGPSKVKEAEESKVEEVHDQPPKAPNADQGSHSDLPANKSPEIEVPKSDDLPQNIPSGPPTPKGESEVPLLPGVGEKRKRGDQSLATDDGKQETTVPLQIPGNDLPQKAVGPSSRHSSLRDQVKAR
ncbi:kinase-like domain-containing protein [Usnea florida]